MKKKNQRQAEEFAAAFRELGGDRKRLAERFGISIKTVHWHVARLRLAGLLGKDECKSSKLPSCEEFAAALRELDYDRQKTAEHFGISLKAVYGLTQQARLAGLLGKDEGKTAVTYNREEFAAAFRELGGDRKKLAERFGISLKAVKSRVAKLRQAGLLGKDECTERKKREPLGHKTVDRSITMVFTNAAGDIFCVTQKIGQERLVKFSFILNGSGKWYESATLLLSAEDVRQVERGITFALASRMLSDARRQMERGEFDVASYMATRIAMLRCGVAD